MGWAWVNVQLIDVHVTGEDAEQVLRRQVRVHLGQAGLDTTSPPHTAEQWERLAACGSTDELVELVEGFGGELADWYGAVLDEHAGPMLAALRSLAG